MSNTYDVKATRNGDWWEIEIISGLPDSVLGVSQARRLTEVEDVARSLVVDLLEVDAADVGVNILIDLPADLKRMQELFHDADVIEGITRTEAALARSRVAAAFLAADMTMRETGAVLGVSHQRIKQLVDRAPDHEPVDLLSSINQAYASAIRHEHGS